MFGLNEKCRYYFCQRQVNMSNGINGLYKIIKNEMYLSPISGDIFIFFSRNKRNVKLLKWDTDGFLLYHKRLEKGSFEMPDFDASKGSYILPWKTFSLIMQGVSLQTVKYRKRLHIEV